VPRVHPGRGLKGISRRAVEEGRVRTDRAHAALVLDRDGVARVRQVGEHAWIVSRVVYPT
jgi:hypothetical protein